MARRQDIDSPADDYMCFEPDGAEKLPTKHYPASTNLATRGPETTIEGPCDAEKGDGTYHK